MASCKAGECEVECGGGKGCGCIAESDYPSHCACYCFGGKPGNGLQIGSATLVDVSISELPFFETAAFLNKVHTETIVIPMDKMNEQVSLTLEKTAFEAVLNQLGLLTREGIKRRKRKLALQMFFAGFLIGALLFSLSLVL
jgi:hypothetical protein